MPSSLLVSDHQFKYSADEWVIDVGKLLLKECLSVLHLWKLEFQQVGQL